jgi:hypothetical protein
MDFVLIHTKSLLGSDEVLHMELDIDVHLSRVK